MCMYMHMYVYTCVCLGGMHTYTHTGGGGVICGAYIHIYIHMFVPYIRVYNIFFTRAESIRKEIQELASQGYREITLLGQNIDAWGR